MYIELFSKITNLTCSDTVKKTSNKNVQPISIFLAKQIYYFPPLSNLIHVARMQYNYTWTQMTSSRMQTSEDN